MKILKVLKKIVVFPIGIIILIGFIFYFVSKIIKSIGFLFFLKPKSFINVYKNFLYISLD